MNTLSKTLAALTVTAVVIGPIVHARLPEEMQDPSGTLGLALGFLAMALIAFGGFYSVRRSRLWHKWGRLETWLSLHTYLSIVAVLVTLLHADFRFRPGVANVAMILLVIVTISGVVGWAIYILYPPRISSMAEEVLTPEEIFHQMEDLQKKADKLKSRLKRQEGEEAQNTKNEITQLADEMDSLKKLLDHEFRQEAVLGSWLYVHIPLSAALLVVASVHAFMTYYL